MLPVETQVFVSDEVELFSRDDRPDDQNDGDSKLDDNEDFSEKGFGEAGEV
jgi:hypothetical protein